MQLIVFLLVLLGWSWADNVGCAPCDPACANWSCITNCSQDNPPSNPTFDTYRCAVDRNGNGLIDGCDELPACQLVNGRYVCPTDLSDSLCTSSLWKGPIPFDPNPNDPDGDIWAVYQTTSPVSYSQYKDLLSQFGISCFPTPQGYDGYYNFIGGRGLLSSWVCGGALYPDGWFSAETCDYISYDGSTWVVANNDCANPNKTWLKTVRKCYPTAFRFEIRKVWTYTHDESGNWNPWTREDKIYRDIFVGGPPQGSFRYVEERLYGGYTIELWCSSSTTVIDAASQRSLNLCTEFIAAYTIIEREPDFDTVYRYFPVTAKTPPDWDCSVPTQGRNSRTLYRSGRYLIDEETWRQWEGGSFDAIVVIELKLYSTSYGEFYQAIESRRNDNLVGVGVDSQGMRCGVCGKSTSDLGGGYEKQVPDPSASQSTQPENSDPSTSQPVNSDNTAQCVNPRFFSGHAQTCRPGGLTTLGASCCGLSGWTKSMCSKGEKELKKKRQAGLCKEVGTYCSKRILRRICIERKKSFCCFNSALARVLQECGRPQIGKGWGSPKNPDCSGYTIEEFSSAVTSDACAQAIEWWAAGMARALEQWATGRR